MELGIAGVEDAVRVGAGGAAEVYAARQPEFGRQVAVKVFPVDEDPLRLERERLAAGRLADHPNVVPVLGSGVCADGRPYLLAAFMPGGSLADLVRRDGPLAPERAAAIGADIARAVAAAHRRGIRHGDIKPQNILFDGYGTPRLADFGVARAREHALSYLAPELILGAEGTDAADLYSLGATLYFAVEGRHLLAPMADETYEAMLYRRLTAQPEVAFSWRTPPWLRAVLRRALSPLPQDRNVSAVALADELAAGPATGPAVEWSEPVARPEPARGSYTARIVHRRWTGRGHDPAPATVPPLPALTPRHPPRRRLAAAVSAAAAVLLAAGGGIYSVVADRTGGDRQALIAEYTTTTEAADRDSASAAVSAVRRASGQDDPMISAARIVYTGHGVGGRGLASMDVAKPGALQATDTYTVSNGDASSRPIAAPGAAERRLFPVSDIDWARIPGMMTVVGKRCGTAAVVADAFVRIRGGRDRPTIRLDAVDLATGTRGAVEFSADGATRTAEGSCNDG